MDDTKILENRFTELYERAYGSSSYCFTDFLGMTEISVLMDMTSGRRIPTGYVSLFGGADGCERQMARFGSPAEFGWEESWPISIIKASPLIDKFSDELTHRDFLGALMNLGIERDTIGDIKIDGHTAYIFAASRMAEHIITGLDSIKHTHVKCELLNEMPVSIAAKFEEMDLIVPSLRADAIVAEITRLSRSKALELFREKKVFINGREYENNSGVLKDGDSLVIRGFGRYVLDGAQYQTKKGNTCIRVRRYI